MNKSNYKKIASIILANIICANYTYAENESTNLDVNNNINKEKKLNLKETFLNYYKIPIGFILGSGFTLVSQKTILKLNNNEKNIKINSINNNNNTKNELFEDTELEKKINDSFAKYIEYIISKLENNIKTDEFKCDDASEESILAKEIINYLSEIQENISNNLYENMIADINTKKLWSERLLTFANYIPEDKNPYIKFICNLVIKSGAFKKELSTNKLNTIHVVKLNNTQTITPDTTINKSLLPSLQTEQHTSVNFPTAPPPPSPPSLTAPTVPPPPAPDININNLNLKTVEKPPKSKKIEINTVENALEDITSHLSPDCDKQTIINKCHKYSTDFFGENGEININKIENIFEDSGKKLNINSNIMSIFKNIKSSNKQNNYSYFDIDNTDNLFKYWPIFCNTNKENYGNFKLACENLCNAYNKYISENVQKKSKQANLFGNLNSNKLTMTIKNDTSNLREARKNFESKLGNIIKCGLNCYDNKTSLKQPKNKIIKKELWYEKNNENSWVKQILEDKSSKCKTYADNSLNFLKNIQITLENIEKLEDKISLYDNKIKKYNNLLTKQESDLSEDDKEFIEMYKELEQKITINLQEMKELLYKFSNDYIIKKINSLDLKDQAKLRNSLKAVANKSTTLSNYLKYIVLELKLDKYFVINNILNQSIEDVKIITDNMFTLD